MGETEKGDAPKEAEESRRLRSPVESMNSATAEKDDDTMKNQHARERPQDSPATKDNLSRQLSQTSTTRTRSYPPIVPRSQRRGLLARFTIIPEVTDPYAYPNSTKWIITITIALAAVAGPMGSAIVLPTLGPIAKDFGVSSTITNLSVALYMLSLAIFPLWWSSFSETFGRRTIYLVSFVISVVFAVLSAVSTSIGMLIVMRFLSGGAAASVQALGAGTIADIWEAKERGSAMGIFYLGPLCGPLLSPIIGGVLADTLGWRSTQWFLAIFGSVLVGILVFVLPETLKSKKPLIDQAKSEENAQLETEIAITGLGDGETAIEEVEADSISDPKERPQTLTRTVTRQSIVKHSKRSATFIKQVFIDPLNIILLLRFPVVFFTVVYASMTFGSLYFLNISIERTFSKPPYNFSTLIIGLLYIPNSLGYVLASLVGGRWLDHIMKREAKKAGRYDEKGKLVFKPEDRMRENAWLAAILYPLALMWYGWSAQKGVHWICPMIANFFFGIGSMIVFAMATTMLTEFMPKRASTGIACNNFLRNIFTFIGTVTASPAIGAIGNGRLFTILGSLALLLGIVTITAMKKFGRKWAEDMHKKLDE